MLGSEPNFNLLSGRKLAPIIWLTIFVPPTVILCFIHLYGVNVLWRDEWDEVPALFEQLSAGRLTLSSLWPQHNEHRIMIPRLMMLLLGLPTRYNTLIFMYFTGICLMSSAYAIFIAFRRQYGINALLLFLPVSFLIFSLRQFENLLWGFQIGFALAACLPVVGFSLLFLITPDRYHWKFTAAVTVAILATYSSAQGLLVWPAGIIPLWMGPADLKIRGRLAATWIAAGALAWYVYFIGYTNSVEHTPVTVSPEYFLAVLGGSLFGTKAAATTAAIFILSLLVVALVQLIKQGRLRPNSFWLAMLLFSLLVEGAITTGRSQFGTGQALASRYATFSILTVIGVYGLISSLMLENQNSLNRVFFAMLVGLTIGAVASAAEEGFYAGKTLRSAMEASARAIVSCESPPTFQADLAYLYPDTIRLHQQSAVMRKLRLSTFAMGGLPEKCDSQ